MLGQDPDRNDRGEAYGKQNGVSRGPGHGRHHTGDVTPLLDPGKAVPGVRKNPLDFCTLMLKSQHC
jgi:hypothetical protein